MNYIRTAIVFAVEGVINMDENINFLNTVVAEIVAQLECVEDLLADDGRFDEQVYMVEQTRIAIENKLHKLKHQKPEG